MSSSADKRSAAHAFSPASQAALLACGNIGAISLYVLPLLATAIITAYGASDAFVGYAMATQLTTLAATSIFISRRLPTIRRRWLYALTGVAFIALGSFMSAAAPSSVHLLLCRALVGVGEGTAFALTNGVIARNAGAHRFYSILTAAKSAFAVLLFSVTPMIVEQFGGRGAFVVHGVAVLLLSPFLLLFPSPAKDAQTAIQPRVARGPISRDGVLLLIAWSAFQVAVNSMWTFTGRIAEQAGVSSGQLSTALIVSAAFAVLVPIAAGMVGLRAGLMKPLAVAGALKILECALVVHASSPLAYFVLLVPGGVTLYLAYPYISALGASLDPSGRLAAALPGAHALGSAIGPGVAGLILSLTGKMVAVGYMATAATALFMICALPLAFATDRRKRTEAEAIVASAEEKEIVPAFAE